jgi:hypothetical protein
MLPEAIFYALIARILYIILVQIVISNRGLLKVKIDGYQFPYAI